DGQRVDLADPAMVEVARVRMVDGVLPLPPAVGREQKEAEDMAPAAVRLPGCEQRVVSQVVEERVHAGEGDRGDQAEPDRPRRARRADRGDDPDADVRQDDARDLPEAAQRVALQDGAEVLLPALAGWEVCGLHGVDPLPNYAPRSRPDQLRGWSRAP